MQPYHFSMEKILDWREDLEEIARKEVKNSENRLTKEKQKLESLLKESRKLKSDNLFKSNIDSVRRHSLYKEMLDENIIQQKLVIKNVEAQLSIVRENLAKAKEIKGLWKSLKKKNDMYIKKQRKKKNRNSWMKFPHCSLEEISPLIRELNRKVLRY